MKQVLFFLFCTISCWAIAQTPQLNVKPLPKFQVGVTVYEKPNYQGNKVNYIEAGVYTAPFIIKSIKIQQGYDVYTQNVGECFGGVLTADNASLPGCDAKIAILALPDTKSVDIVLSSITNNIHNNDCKKMYGTVNMSITYEDMNYVAYPKFNTNFISWDKSVARSVNETHCSNLLNVKRSVRLAPSIWAKCHIKVETDLGSAHKGCDLCTDFNWNAKMPSKKTFEADMNQVFQLWGGNVPVGPYKFSDNKHSTTLCFNFRRL